MEALAVLFVVWVFVTFVGHGSFVVVRALFRAMVGDDGGFQTVRRDQSDTVVTQRVLLEMSERGLLTPAEMEKLRRSLRELTVQQESETIAKTPKPQTFPLPKLEPSALASSPVPERERQTVIGNVAWEEPPARTVDSQDRPAASTVDSSSEPILAELICEAEIEPALPAISKAEIVRSFLAANNIRWGELVAGMLIVVCSIGLVISLWNTITENRFVPSMIFLGANAAIYAAGFYTLSRWRLRHTSRAVLAIATLLVPLTVLAGIAAAGPGPDAVQLTEPLTLLAIGLAGAVYGFLVYRGGNSLARWPYAIPIALAVVGPVSAIPLLPAAIRNFGPDAAWIVAFASATVLAALSRSVRMRKSNAMPLGLTGGRSRLLVIAFAAFAMSVTVGYAAFALREFGQGAMMKLALATMPAIVGLAASGRSLTTGASRDSQAMTGSILCVVSMGLAWVILPPATLRADWVWSWGLILAASTAASTWLFREPRWLAISTLPIGIAATLTSTVWIGGQVWNEVGFWNRCIAGEPMLAAALVGAVVGAISWLLRTPLPLVGRAVSESLFRIGLRRSFHSPLGESSLSEERGEPVHKSSMLHPRRTPPQPLPRPTLPREGVEKPLDLPFGEARPESSTSPSGSSDSTMQRWLGISSIFWLSVSLSIAILLTIAPISFLGVAPWWSVTAVLLSGVLVTAALANQHQRFAVGTIVTVVFAVASVFRPFGTETWFEFAPPTDWIYAWLSVSAGLLLLSEFANRFVGNDPNRRLVLDLWNHAGCATGVLAAAIACSTAPTDWQTSAVALACAAGLLFWSSSLSQERIPWITCQIATLALAIVIGYGRYSNTLFAADAWKTGVAPFGWAIVGSAVVVFWLSIRQFLTFSGMAANRRLQYFQSDQLVIEQTPQGLVSLIATALVAIGSAWAFAGLLSSGAGNDAVVFETLWQMPVLAFLSVGMIIAWTRYQQREEDESRTEDFSGYLATITTVSIVAWLASHIASLFAVDPQVRLVLATSLASAVYLLSSHGLNFQRFGWLNRIKPVASFLVLLMIVLSSVVLLADGWLDPVLRGQLADPFSTLAVATWWIAGSVALFVHGNRNSASVSSLASSLLAPSVAALVVPVFYQVDPVVWIQVAALVSVTWCLVAYWLMDREQSEAAEPAINLSRGFVMIVGIGSAVIAAMEIVFDIAELRPYLSFAGVCVSVVSVVYWCTIGLDSRWDNQDDSARLPPPAGIAFLAGPIAWSASQFGLITGVEIVELLAALWLGTSVASLIRHGKDRFAPTHIVLISVGLLIIDAFAGSQSDKIPAFAIAGLCAAGCLVAFASWSNNRSIARCFAYRILGWFVIVGGGYLLLSRVGLPNSDQVAWTVIVGWSGLWVVLWRVLSRRNSDGDRTPFAFRFGVLPDIGVAILLALAAFGEAVLSTAFGSDFYMQKANDPLLIARLITFALVAASVVYRASRTIAWTASTATILSIVALVFVQFANDFEATPGQRFASALLPAGFLVALLANWIRPVAGQLSRFSGEQADQIGASLIRSAWQSALVIAGSAGFAAIAMIVNQTTPEEINMTIVAVALAAWAFATIADASNRLAFRHVAVSLALVTIGLWASVNPIGTTHPLLVMSMRWIVASVFTIPMILFVFPKLIGPTIAGRWQCALTRGAIVAAVAAGLSLAGMLSQEVFLRSSEGIEGVSQPMVIGVAVTLSILSGLAGLVAIQSGPTSQWRERLTLSDQQRVGLVYVAQAIGVITWLHLFLCKPHWAFVGLRGYWPYIVMGLSFLSVGATEWARRRGDRVLSMTMKNTALYLPLIPVIGFWFGVVAGQFDPGQFDWLFNQGKVRYDVLLTLGACYYIAVSVIWKEVAPRLAAVVLGNAAWWILLVQQPGWGFLAHPQLWLIPPAVCVLVAVHLYRDRLQPSVASSVRYVATLVIYLSSTADMLLQQIGQSISGPIILILLALAGMAIGVILKVRPFLYLGGMFVFIGVTSMVWHAQQSIGEVWPWWVFGITTGICLLAGLMALEKNKPKLRKYANELSTWQG